MFNALGIRGNSSFHRYCEMKWAYFQIPFYAKQALPKDYRNHPEWLWNEHSRLKTEISVISVFLTEYILRLNLKGILSQSIFLHLST